MTARELADLLDRLTPTQMRSVLACWWVADPAAFTTAARAAMQAPVLVCANCGQPVERCDDGYPAHKATCGGWRHTGGFHRCVHQLAHAVPADTARAAQEVAR